ncbi:TolC family outer membrane protein [soil metagenome]
MLADPFAEGQVDAQGAPVPPPPLPPLDSEAPAPDAPPLASTPIEPPPGVQESLRDAIVAALKGNPDIQIALARQDDAKYGVDEARSGYLPHLDMAVALGSEYNDPSVGNDTRLRRGEGVVTLSQNLWDFGTTINDIKRARASYRSAQWSTRERIEAIAFDITTAYMDVLERQKLVDLAIAQIAAHEKILKMVTIQNELGLTTVADVNRAKARLDNVRADVLDRKSALEQSRESYRRLTDHLPGVAIDLPSPATALPITADAAVAMIDDHSPRMAQAVEDRRSLDRQRASQTGTFFPRVGLQAQGNWKDDVQGATGLNRDARAMVTVTYSFFNGGADIAIRNRISARLREADYELDRRRREVEQDIRIDFNALQAARQKIGTIESEIQASERVVELYNQQFREGRRTVFDLLDSQQILFAARASQITNNTARMVSEFRVLQKLGGLFDLVSSGEPLPPLVMPAPGSAR